MPINVNVIGHSSDDTLVDAEIDSGDWPKETQPLSPKKVKVGTPALGLQKTPTALASVYDKFERLVSNGSPLGAEDDVASWPAGAPRESIFPDAEGMKNQVRQSLLKESYDVSSFYKSTGIWQAIARHAIFEQCTLLVVALNAVWIFVDTDFNPSEILSEAPIIFQVAEHGFCTFFVCEWTIRFMAFRRKLDGLKDSWFVFDTVLVGVMVSDTWIMQIAVAVAGVGEGSSFGDASILRLLRLLRLMRLARMARLLRALPELMILMKGMVAALRSVVFTLLLVFITTYVFAIAFVHLAEGSSSGELYFSSVPHAMYSLVLHGTFLDSISKLMDATIEDSLLNAFVLLLFVLLSAMTLMNLLIGILCEVVSNVSSLEKDELAVLFVKSKLESILRTFDENGDNMISKTEFEKLITNKEAAQAFLEVHVDPAAMIDIADVIFEAEDSEGESYSRQLSFPEFMEVVLDMRGGNNCTVKDVVNLKKFVRQIAEDTNVCIRNTNSLVAELDTKVTTFLEQSSAKEASPVKIGDLRRSDSFHNLPIIPRRSVLGPDRSPSPKPPSTGHTSSHEISRLSSKDRKAHEARKEESSEEPCRLLAKTSRLQRGRSSSLEDRQVSNEKAEKTNIIDGSPSLRKSSMVDRRPPPVDISSVRSEVLQTQRKHLDEELDRLEAEISSDFDGLQALLQELCAEATLPGSPVTPQRRGSTSKLMMLKSRVSEVQKGWEQVKVAHEEKERTMIEYYVQNGGQGRPVDHARWK